MPDLVIKVRHKMAADPWALAALLLLANLASGLPKCDKMPLERGSSQTRGDNGFAISVAGSPRLYRPNQIYTIVLQGIREDAPVKFQGFVLVAEHDERNPVQDPATLGTFQLMTGDAMTKFSHRCSHAVEATSSISKERVEVYWTAPPERGSGCIQFKAMVVERKDAWYMDDGALKYTLCEDNSPSAEPTKVQDCCACNEAKYELIFEGIWSRHTHPKDFPKDEWRTQFSKLIGASHSKAYSLWEYGRQSSPALEALSRHGVTHKLEGQMKQFSGQIRSVIKAHGLQQRSNVAGQTFAVFRVDPNHHLMSFVSKMIPSPDWIIGLSKEDLCLTNCTWVENRVIDLYPWDAGVETGFKYDSPLSPSVPRGFIQRITSSNPDDPASPFWDEQSSPMKPAARLHIIKQREYRAACPNAGGRPRTGPGAGRPSEGLNPSWNLGSSDYGSEGTSYMYGVGIGQQLENEVTRNEETMDYDQYGTTDRGYGAGSSGDSYYTDFRDRGGNGNGNGGGYESSLDRPPDNADYGGSSNDACRTTQWSRWSQCSSSCDSGSRNRQRQYADARTASANQCQERLFFKEPCRNLPRCEAKSYSGTFNPFPADDDRATPGGGYSTPWLERGLESDGLKAGGSSYDPYGNSYVYGGLSPDGSPDVPKHSSYRGLPEKSCDVQGWGEWSDCSSMCDRGTRTRKRTYLRPERSGTCSEELNDREHCLGDGSDCPARRRGGRQREPVASLGFDYVKPHFKEGDPECEVSGWSEWSPCSSGCGPGRRVRTRLYMIPFVEDRKCDIKLRDKESCYGSDSSCSDDAGSYYGDHASDDAGYGGPERTEKPQAQEDPCKIEKDAGPCRGHYNRWYFDSDDLKCNEFVFHGCNGNRNNFPTEEKCLETCWHMLSEASDGEGDPASVSYNNDNNDGSWSSNRQNRFGGGVQWVEGVHDDKELDRYKGSKIKDFDSMSLIKLTPEQESSGSFKPPRIGRPVRIDCQASAWSEWSSCSQSCGVGWSTKKRDIMVRSGNGGRNCPKKLNRRRKCHQMPCPADTKYWYQGSWRHMTED